jgi:plastocyanin
VSPTRRISGPPPRRTVIASFAAQLAMVLALAGCGGDDNKTSTEATTTSTTPTATTQNVNDHGTKNFADESGGEVELDDNYFAPTVIQGKAGQTLRLELKNEGSAEHSFTLTDQNIDRDVAAGEDAKVSVKVPRSGKVDFFCKYHKAQGMAGSLAASSARGGGSSGGGSSGGGSSGGGSSGGGGSGSGSSGGTTTGSSGSSGGGYGY